MKLQEILNEDLATVASVSSLNTIIMMYIVIFGRKKILRALETFKRALFYSKHREKLLEIVRQPEIAEAIKTRQVAKLLAALNKHYGEEGVEFIRSVYKECERVMLADIKAERDGKI